MARTALLAALAALAAVGPAAARDDVATPPAVALILLSPDPADGLTVRSSRALLDAMAAEGRLSWSPPGRPADDFKPCLALDRDQRDERVACVRRLMTEISAPGPHAALVIEMGVRRGVDWDVDCVGLTAERDRSLILKIEQGLHDWPGAPGLRERTRDKVEACVLGAAGLADRP